MSLQSAHDITFLIQHTPRSQTTHNSLEVTKDKQRPLICISKIECRLISVIAKWAPLWVPYGHMLNTRGHMKGPADVGLVHPNNGAAACSGALPLISAACASATDGPERESLSPHVPTRPPATRMHIWPSLGLSFSSLVKMTCNDRHSLIYSRCVGCLLLPTGAQGLIHAPDRFVVAWQRRKKD